ncbi:50S ribosomal protein L18 [Legionella geestiana]|uniref:Large ribosomal subunit protein uL18 n=1 Tax=Legionella geestiana TaxID=45065 RepID=A0A0W0TTV8_9GAMM|nr:50S ribosomal protein L18 [Legionella geestiana]KTC99055.1 50S ribosomal protein L18 [Legionella geestiana]QBS12614.1 50S ribosomal protein L18 [Legionella geestiana]QDQ39668.1 50S ribosomal protein L18 [Legionella geestiana]STX54928.1 50S ribosomal protein L18 [Legionella geestiana]
MNKELARSRRGKRTKAIIRRSERARLVVFRSGLHMYAQIIVPGTHGDNVVVSCSTLDKELRTGLSGNKTDQARKVGQLIAARAIANNLKEVAFDRAGYRYHGRVKALAEAAREAGLNF